MLMDYIENFATENNISYELYDSAKYAVQNRTFEKITELDLNLFEKYKEENLNKNINYI